MTARRSFCDASCPPDRGRNACAQFDCLGDIGCFDANQCRSAERALAERYGSSQLFPHIVLDDFLDPGVLRRVLPRFPESAGPDYCMRRQERMKLQFNPDECQGPVTRGLASMKPSVAPSRYSRRLSGTSEQRPTDPTCIRQIGPRLISGNAPARPTNATGA